MTLNLHALVRDFGIWHSGISLHCLESDSVIEGEKVWGCTIYLLCDGSKLLVDDIDQRLHPTLFASAVYNECIPYCVSPSYGRHIPLSSLLIREKVCNPPPNFSPSMLENVRLYGSRGVQFWFMNNWWNSKPSAVWSSASIMRGAVYCHYYSGTSK